MSMCWAEGGYVNWPSTPGGNEIKQVSLSPGDVVSTANTMISIASRMQSASTTLQELANSDDGQQGKAVEALRDSVGETWEILGDAGDMYYHTADAIRTYGHAIGDVGGIAEALSAAYTVADEKWSTYAGADGDLHGDTTADPDDDDPNAESDASDNKAKYDAFQAWMNAANQWDQHYDDWETAWNKAVSAIEDAHEHGPKDGWNEWWGDFLEVAYIIVTIIAIVAGVIALVLTFVVTGPILAAIAAVATVVAAVAGVVVAVISIARYARGETSLTGMILDIVCAVPGVGPVAKLFSKLGPLTLKLGLGASGLAADFLPSMVRIGADGMPYFERVFANGVSDLIMHGSIGAGMAFEMPNVVRITDTISTTLEFTAPYTIMYATKGLIDMVIGDN